MQPRRFSRKSRLLCARDFQSVFNGVQYRVAHPNFLILAADNLLGHPRVGLVVAKKNVRRAVGRNRVKRVVRETFRLTDADLNGIDVVFLARKGIDKLSPAEQTASLTKAWRRLAAKVSGAKQN